MSGSAESDAEPESASESDLVAALLDGHHRSLARVITRIENRSAGYRDLVSDLHEHTGDAHVVGVTGSPGAGKSTLVDKLAKHYRDEGLTVGVIAVDPSSPYTGGAVLGDRIRMASNVGDMEVFFRSMSARGTLGGLSTATTDAVRALDAFGKDVVIVETVGAGQNEIDIVRTADTVAVLVQPASGDDVQMLKAGILEIGDVFVVNKADLDGASRTVTELKEMIHMRGDEPRVLDSFDAGGHHGTAGAGSDPDGHGSGGGAEQNGGGDTTDHDAGADDPETEPWTPPVVETVATSGEGIEELADTLADHLSYLERSGELEAKERTRYAEEIRALLRSDVGGLLEGEIRRQGGMASFVDAIYARETDPYTVAEELLNPVRECLEERDGE
ncbi:methylmalonyl Co-A mutase-associated GTPase MeaB [Halobium salinum]|uniref:Methylmalonyl Co-A mutase-associated GTPase MeaB n=1 Tax=Halobium salinum TaxID=1364940 RepID=A0ABD5PCF6_9EURY|nr:methylmalonyl Co-A mutase-associated GTPase MeaB [Halobium salinum]